MPWTGSWTMCTSSATSMSRGLLGSFLARGVPEDPAQVPSLPPGVPGGKGVHPAGNKTEDKSAQPGALSWP